MTKSSLQVVAGATQALSPQQKKFNTLMQQIGKQRDLLRDWEAAAALFRQRYTAEIVPLQHNELVLKEQLLRLFDHLSEQKLAKADKAHLAMLICSYADDVLAAEEDGAKIAEIKAIFNRHADTDYDQEQAQIEQEQDAELRAMAEQMFGLQLDDEELATPDALLQKLAEKFQQEADQQEALDPASATKPASSKASKTHAAKARKQEEADKQASQSVREIYRKLASSLHPDRETDPIERERKTALMQRANQAYAAGQLLQLLELQLEMEQIDTEHITGLSNERLKHYNQVLNEQLRDIKMEAELMEDSFKAEFGVSPFEKLTPKKLTPMLAAEVASRKRDLLVLDNQLQAFTEEPKLFKAWLKDDRLFHKEQEQILLREGGFFY